MEVQANRIKIKYHSIDFWSRVIFITEKNLYISSIDVLYDKDKMGDTPESISNYFRNNIELLTYHGTDIDDDPIGTRLKYNLIDIVEEF